MVFGVDDQKRRRKSAVNFRVGVRKPLRLNPELGPGDAFRVFTPRRRKTVQRLFAMLILNFHFAIFGLETNDVYETNLIDVMEIGIGAPPFQFVGFSKWQRLVGPTFARVFAL